MAKVRTLRVRDLNDEQKIRFAKNFGNGDVFLALLEEQDEEDRRRAETSANRKASGIDPR